MEHWIKFPLKTNASFLTSVHIPHPGIFLLLNQNVSLMLKRNETIEDPPKETCKWKPRGFCFCKDRSHGFKLKTGGMPSPPCHTLHPRNSLKEGD